MTQTTQDGQGTAPMAEEATMTRTPQDGQGSINIAEEVAGKHTPPDGLGSILIAEYENMHSRVFQQMASFESANVKTLMLYGVLLTFAISYYGATEAYLQSFVDIIFFLVYPVLLAGVAALTVANMGKIMILGDYLMIIENKINKAYAGEAELCGFSKENFEFVMGWEYWRLKFGNNKKGNAYTEATLGVIIIVLEIVVTVICAITRMKYLQDNLSYNQMHNPAVPLPDHVGRAWLLLGISICILLPVLAWGANKYISRSKQAKDRAEDFYNPQHREYSDRPDVKGVIH